ncbi:hypothetical protein, partial [Jannaschia pohangensis]
MKTFITSALIAVATLAAVPASADVYTKLHGSLEGGDRASVAKLGQADNGVTVSTRSGTSGLAYDIFNADQDSPSDLRGLNGATSFSGQPTV